MNDPRIWPDNMMIAARNKAAAFVCSEAIDAKTGEAYTVASAFHPRFEKHPWVGRAEREGFGKELRSYLRQTVENRILNGKSYADVDGLMPSRDWIEAASRQAAKVEAARRWQDENLPENPEWTKLIATLRRVGRERGYEL